MKNALLFLHVLAAAAWIGAGLYLYFIYPRLARKGQAGVTAVDEISATGDKFFGPAAGVVLLTGIGLVLSSERFGWSDAFVWVGIGVFVFSALWQPLVASKVDAKLVKAASSEDPDLGDVVRSWRLVGLIEMAALFVTLWAMIVKLGA